MLHRKFMVNYGEIPEEHLKLIKRLKLDHVINCLFKKTFF